MFISSMNIVEMYSMLLMVFSSELVWKSLINFLFLDLMHVVLSKTLVILFVSYSKCKLWYYCNPIKIFPLCFMITENKWVVEDVVVAFYSRKLMAHASDDVFVEEVSFHLAITSGIYICWWMRLVFVDLFRTRKFPISSIENTHIFFFIINFGMRAMQLVKFSRLNFRKNAHDPHMHRLIPVMLQEPLIIKRSCTNVW